jgi:hypothetical protein
MPGIFAKKQWIGGATALLPFVLLCRWLIKNNDSPNLVLKYLFRKNKQRLFLYFFLLAKAVKFVAFASIKPNAFQL